MIEETAEYDENYPKKDIMNLWIGNMIAFFILFAASYTILMIVTLPFIFFYFMSLSKIFKAWKRFHYKMGYLWTITIIALIVDVAAAILVQWN